MPCPTRPLFGPLVLLLCGSVATSLLVVVPAQAETQEQARDAAAALSATAAAKYEAREFAKAAGLFHQAFALDRGFYGYLYSAARSEEKAGLLAEAERDYLQFRKMAPAHHDKMASATKNLAAVRSLRAAESAAAEKAAAERRAAEKATAARLAAEQAAEKAAAADKLAADKLAAEKRTADKRTADKRAAEEAAERAATAEKRTTDRRAMDLAAERSAVAKAAEDKAAADRGARGKTPADATKTSALVQDKPSRARVPGSGRTEPTVVAGPSSSRRVGGWVAVGGGVVLGIVAGVLYANASGDLDALNRKIEPGFRGKAVTDISWEQAQTDADSIGDRLTFSAVFAGLATAALGTGAVLVAGDEPAPGGARAR